MKKRLLVLVTLVALALQGSEFAHADASIPPADVTCSITQTGVQYSLSMTFANTTVTLSDLTYDWEYAILTPGGDPATSTSYGDRHPLFSTSVNATSLTYDQMLILVGNKTDAILSVFATPKTGTGVTALKNNGGKGCYSDLRVVKKGMDDAVAAANAATDAAAAQAKANADATAALQKVQYLYADKLGNFYEVKSAINNLLSGGSPFFKVNPTLTASLARATNYVLPKFPYQQADLDALTFLLDGNGTTPGLNQDLDTALTGIDAYNAQVKAAAAAALAKSTKVITITCIKGKITKKVKGVKPKCPTGYRLKK
jgi:hypothetical protein